MKTPITNNKFYYQCVNCGNSFGTHELMYLCPGCNATNTAQLPPKGVLKTLYDYGNIKASFSRLRQTRYIDLLPINTVASLPRLKVGDTPLYPITHLNKTALPFQLYLKDDSQNPTYSFKDRASALVSAFAREQGIDTIITASTGNAGSSLAGICASQGQKAIVLLPEAAPAGKLLQSLMYGAHIIRVKGTYDDAFDLSVEATRQFGYYNRNTAFNPLTIEGKKTVAFELFEQLGQKTPGRIFVPVGDGVIISGVYKGFEDLMMLGLIEAMPTLVAVQSASSDSLIRNFEGSFSRAPTQKQADSFSIKPGHTIADSIAVDIPRNFYMAQHFIQKYKGELLRVSDDQILRASSALSENTGLFAEPAAAAAFAGFLSYVRQNKLSNHSSNVVLLTGSGLKDMKALHNRLHIPEAINPDVAAIKKELS